jgi:hypothetical protein
LAALFFLAAQYAKQNVVHKICHNQRCAEKEDREKPAVTEMEACQHEETPMGLKHRFRASHLRLFFVTGGL